MQTAPRPAPERTNIDVVTLFAPPSLPDPDFEGSVTEWSAPDRAVLVVLPFGVDDDLLARLHVAGADLCVVAPTPAELFSHVERARRRHRRACRVRTAGDERLDALWRERSAPVTATQR